MRILQIDQSGSLFQIAICRVLDALCKKDLAEPLEFFDHKFVREDEYQNDNMKVQVPRILLGFNLFEIRVILITAE